ncbi:MAG: TAXI family TRAP transporter solute-binding subunit [Parvibaculaceae bacterium]
MSTVTRLLLVMGMMAALGAGLSHAAEKSRAKSAGHLGHNANTVGIVAGPAGSASLEMMADLAAVLDGKDMRILPIAGKNPVQNVTDLLYLKGIDVAVLPTDVLDYVEANRIHGAVTGRVNYIAKLYGDEVHLIARREIADVKSLAGRKVDVGPELSASAVTGEALLKALKVKVEPTNHDFWDALGKLKAGEIDAMVYVAPRPAEGLTAISAGDGLKLLPVEIEGDAAERYPPSLLTAADYPGLIEANGEVSTVSVGEVLAVFNWERGGARYSSVRRFVSRFLDSFDTLVETSTDRRWKNVNLAAEVEGWQRDDEAKAWLSKASAKKSDATEQGAEELRSAFKRFLETNGESQALSQPDQSELFKRFLNWKEAGGQ